MININLIPKDPGCYLFKDKKSNIIYVGKAKSLKKRVSSYFTKINQDNKTRIMITQIYDIDFIITNNEIEALILENNLIKKYQPKYNIDLKDSKRYTYIHVTNEQFPRLVISRNKETKGKLIGPFTSGSDRLKLMQLLIRLFMLRTCKRMPKRACLRYHINLCSAPCIGEINKKDYDNSLEKAVSVLSGKTSELIKTLKNEMQKSSINLEFEKSIRLRDQISALTFLSEKQDMERQKKYDEDIINYTIKEDIVYLLLFNIYKGILHNKTEFIFDYKVDFFEEFLIQYYSENIVPKELIIPLKVSQVIKKFLEKKRKSRVRVIIPKIGEKKRLLELVKKNIEITFFGDLSKIIALQSKLKLNDIPSVIECFDISHLSGTSLVGSMVQFRNGKPDKNNYRRFKIRSFKGIDDTKAISEVVRRRYTRLINEKINLPNLIIIDGGKGQLNAALSQLKKLNLKIPIISVAKKYEEIFVPGLSIPIKLSKKDKALHLIQSIRDEAHRFAISYHKLLRKKKSTSLK